MKINNTQLDRIHYIRTEHEKIIKAMTENSSFLAHIKEKCENIKNKLLELKYADVITSIKDSEVRKQIFELEKLQKKIENEMKPLLERFDKISKESEIILDQIKNDNPTMTDNELIIEINKKIN